METTTTQSTTKDKSNNNNNNDNNKESTPIYIKFIGFGFYLFQLVVVLCSWRVYFLFTDNNSNNKDNIKDSNNSNSDQPSTNTPITFKEKVQNNFFCLLTDSFYMIMILITFTLFFWRAKPLYTQLKKSESDKWKSIIWDEFSSGGIEFGSFTVLLLLKWPVIFKVFWNKGTDKEDKSTWAEIFMREFTPKEDKDKQSNDSSNAGSGIGSDKARKTLSDEQWKKQFQMDLQNIGFEFGPTGEVTKFPPTEIMEQYQKSNRFRDLILQAGPSKPTENDNDPTIEEYVKLQKELNESQKEKQNQQQSQQIKDQKSNNKKATNRKSKNKNNII